MTSGSRRFGEAGRTSAEYVGSPALVIVPAPRTYDTFRTSTSAGFEVGDLIAFGAEGSYTRKTSQVASAVYLDPSRGAFPPCVQCSS